MDLVNVSKAEEADDEAVLNKASSTQGKIGQSLKLISEKAASSI
jgi:hypothetical protein